MENNNNTENLYNGHEIVDNNYRLVAYTSWGKQCMDSLYPNKAQAIRQGRFLKRENHAFSYTVYSPSYIGKNDIKVRSIVARG